MKKSLHLSGLWTECLQGDVNSFAMIHRELYSSLYYYILGMVRDEGLTEDLLQDLFIRLWEKRVSIGPIEYVKVYFFRAARSITVNHIKKARIKTFSLDDQPYEEIEMEFSPEEMLLEEERNHEMRLVFNKAIGGLPGRQREMLYLKYYDGWNYEEISTITGLRYQSVVNHVHRAIVQLRAELGSCNRVTNSITFTV